MNFQTPDVTTKATKAVKVEKETSMKVLKTIVTFVVVSIVMFSTLKVEADNKAVSMSLIRLPPFLLNKTEAGQTAVCMCQCLESDFPHFYENVMKNTFFKLLCQCL